MKFKIIALCLALITLVLTAETHAKSYPDVKKLKNGMTVLVVEDDRFPIVSTRMYVKAGSVNESETTYGIAHLIEHMAFKGSKSHPDGVDAIIESVGGMLNAYTTYDHTVYFTDMPSAQWKESIQSMQGLVFDLFFEEKDLTGEYEIVKAELKERADNANNQLLHMAVGTSLKNSEYQHPVIGYEETIFSIKTDDMRDFMKNYYNPANMQLVVVGDVQSVEVFAEAEKIFSSYQNNVAREIEQAFTEEELFAFNDGFEIKIQKGNWNKSYVNFSFPIAHENSKYTPAAQMLALLLTFDDNALLPKKFRFDENIVDSIHAFSYFFDRAGVFNVRAQLDAKNIPLFFEEMIEIFKNLNENKFSEEEFEQARNAIENSFWYKNQTIQKMADNYGNLYWKNPSDPLAANWLQNIKNVDLEQLSDFVEKFIYPEAMSLAILLPEKEKIDVKKLENIQEKKWKAIANKHIQVDEINKKTEILEINNKKLVLIYDNTIPFISINAQLLGGESLLMSEGYAKEKVNINGVSTLAAKVMTNRIAKMEKEDFTSFLSKKDISLKAYSDSIEFQVSAHGAKKFSKDILNIFKEVVYNPVFNKDDIEKAKQEQNARVLTIKDSVPASMMNGLAQFLFPAHPYGKDKNGTIEDIKKITQNDLNYFWNKQEEQALVISVAGDFDREEIVEFVKSLPKAKNSIENNSLRVDKPTFTKEKNFDILIEGKNQDMLGIVFPTVDKNHADAPALRVLGMSLTGFNGILFQELRAKRNLGYSPGPIPVLREKAGYIGFTIMTAPTNREKVKEQFIEIVKLLREKGISESELARTKAMLNMSFIKNNQTADKRASMAATAVLFGHDADFDLQYLNKIMNVTKEDVDKVIKKYLILDKAYAIKSGSK